ncbi:hypothetical protein CNMCM5793_007376 [Aspergillus hiratsukae]|uniref:Uncharacterized protein n=1 Tax=Aspergillus hiratsukae TaxID=1194566 RepID=A0A8H6P5K4_9EURO|nr:hypothetical protein CNMCM5793_007376 [Aspergillus hiratsukae]KAF7173108.1 hypothetical protein CNMCM6106_007251 [Aspergillus hiratsukae]
MFSEASPEPGPWSPSQPRPDLIREPVEPRGLRARRFFYGTDSDEESEDNIEWNTAEDSQEDTDDDEEEDSNSTSDSRWDGRGATVCVLRDYSPVPPVRDYGPAQRVQEWEDLGREPLGFQFWRGMRENRAAGPAMHIRFQAYARYGFAFWEERRMMQLGLWSHHAFDDPVEYYQRWYTFLSPEDLDRWKPKF